MDLVELQRHWEAFGQSDPLWAILTEPSKRGGGWDLDEFFREGRVQIERVLADVARLGVAVPRGRALDFGCGVGRLTQALGDHFGRCDGVDIAPTMIELARRYNRHGDRCEYHLNPADDLSLFGDGTFDLVYSFAVLQHIRPVYIRRYVREFVRALAPGGLAVFQLPIEPASQALPASGFRAEVAVIEAPATWEAGRPATVGVRVRNVGDAVWWSMPGLSGCENVRLGNHWLARRGRRVVVKDDARAFLPRDVVPGAAEELALTVCPPSRPDRYVLELDLVQEGVAWFGDRGSRTTRLDVQARRPRRPSAIPAPRFAPPPTPADGQFRPVMEMHGLPREEVVSLLEAAGGRVVEARAVVAGDWRHGLYAATKDAL